MLSRKNDKWKWFDLDFILEQTEKTFTHVGFNKPLAVDELPLNIIIEGTNFSTKTHSNESHLFLDKENLWKNYNNYSVSEKGNDPNGKAVLLKFSNVSSLNNYIIIIIIIIIILRQLK